MNKSGQMSLGNIMFVFIAVIVGVILFQAIAQQVGTTTNTITVSNESLSTVVNNTPQYLTNYKAISDVTMWNATGDTIVKSGNYTITNNFVRNGALTVKITPTYSSADLANAWKISGTAQPLTYISNSGARSMAGLITIFFALLVAAIALYPVYQNKILDIIGK